MVNIPDYEAEYYASMRASLWSGPAEVLRTNGALMFVSLGFGCLECFPCDTFLRMLVVCSPQAPQFVDIPLAEEDSSDEEYHPDEEEEDETAEDVRLCCDWLNSANTI